MQDDIWKNALSLAIGILGLKNTTNPPPSGTFARLIPVRIRVRVTLCRVTGQLMRRWVSEKV